MKSKKEYFYPCLRPFPQRAQRWDKLKSSNLPGYKVVPGKVVSAVEYFLPETAVVKKDVVIAYLSDLHFHDSKKSWRILCQLQKFLEQYSPDYLLLGGDMTGDADDIALLENVLKKLSKYAKKTIAVGGNWEYGKTWLAKDFWKKFYNGLGIVYLENESFDAGEIVFSGLADLTCGTVKLPEFDENKYNILLAHNPDAVVAIDSKENKNFPQLILAGHNHGGQVNVPLLNIPIHIHSRYGTKFAHGAFFNRKRGSTMLVSAGVNELSFPWRIGCRRDLIILRAGGNAL